MFFISLRATSIPFLICLHEEQDNADANSPTKVGTETSVAAIKHIPPNVAAFGVPMAPAGPGTPHGSHPTIKRKSSFTGREIDATGGASHVGALMYPAHYCAFLVVHSHDISCMPYGKHTYVHFSVVDTEEDSPLQRRARVSTSYDAASIVRSTEPIDWCEIANCSSP